MKRFAWMFALALITAGLLLWALRVELGGVLREPVLATLALLVVAVGIGAGAMAQRPALGIACAGVGAWAGLLLSAGVADAMQMTGADEFIRTALFWMAAGCATTLSLCLGPLALAQSELPAAIGIACIPPVLAVFMYVAMQFGRLVAGVVAPSALIVLEVAGLVVAAAWRRREATAKGGDKGTRYGKRSDQ